MSLRPALILSTALLSAQAQAVPLLDTYIGGHDHGYGDVIGDRNVFDVQRAEINRESGRLRIDIFTNFVGRSGGFASHTQNGKGIGYGDLFLSGAWTPFVKPGDTSAANVDGHLFDTAANGTRWTFALSFDDAWSTATSGSFSFYALNGSNAENLVMTEELFKPGVIVRDAQPVHVDRNSSTVTRLGGGNWTADATSAERRLSFDLDLSLDPSQRIAGYDYLSLHWGMTCNNDVIQGGVALPPLPGGSVPEPTTMSLLGAALMGLVATRRRRAMHRD